MRRHLLALGTGALLLVVPATATADYQVGEDPFNALPTGATFDCAAGACTIATDWRANAPLRVPDLGTTDHGVITRWAVSGRNGQVRLRRLSGDLTTPLGASAPGQLPASLGPVGFSTDLPVRTGDALGIDLSAGAEIAGEPGWVSGADSLVGWSPTLGDAGARAADFAADGSLYLSVWIEPDANQDGRGDETHPPPAPPDPPAPPAPPTPPTPDPPRADPPRSDPPRTDVPRADPYAGLPRAGPSVTIDGRAAASKRGVASFTLKNPYGFKTSGTVKVKRGRRAVGSAKVTLAPYDTRVVRVRLDRSGKRTVARGGKLKLTLAATLRAGSGRARTTTKPVTVTSGTPTAPPARRGPAAPPTRGGDAAGFDGTYRAPDGLVMVVENGVVTTFHGDITTYCTKAGKQRLVSFGMFGDDPDPTVAADGSFAYEATRGYGFVKLKYDGRIAGGRASGRLVVEDRSPLLGSERIEFDYCFAGKDWTASK